MWICFWELKTNGQRTAPTMSYHPPQDVPTCCLRRTERGGMQYIRQGIWQQMPQLNPEADMSAVQLVQPETSWEELLDIYLEVYKLCRLPGSPPGEPAILKEVSAALPCHSMEEVDTPDAPKQLNSDDLHPPQSRLPRCDMRKFH